MQVMLMRKGRGRERDSQKYGSMLDLVSFCIDYYRIVFVGRPAVQGAADNAPTSQYTLLTLSLSRTPHTLHSYTDCDVPTQRNCISRYLDVPGHGSPSVSASTCSVHAFWLSHSRRSVLTIASSLQTVELAAPSAHLMASRRPKNASSTRIE